MTDWRELRTSLDHSSAGKEIAASGPLLAQYMRVEEEQARLAYPADSVRERVEPLAERSRKIAGGGSVAAAPSDELVGKIAVDIEEADRALRAQKEVNETVRTLIAQAEADDIPAADVDLAKAMALLAERRKQEELRILPEAAEKGEALTNAQLAELAEQKAGELGALAPLLFPLRHEPLARARLPRLAVGGRAQKKEPPRRGWLRCATGAR